jgi:hypothetical protein
MSDDIKNNLVDLLAWTNDAIAEEKAKMREEAKQALLAGLDDVRKMVESGEIDSLSFVALNGESGEAGQKPTVAFGCLGVYRPTMTMGLLERLKFNICFHYYEDEDED